MNHQPVRWLSALLVCLATAALVGAQPKPQPLNPPSNQPQGTESSDPRHVLLPGGLDRGDAKDMLARKLRRTQDLQQTKDLVNDVIKNPERYGMTDDDLAKWIEEYGKNGGKVDPDKIDPKTFDPSKVDPSDPKVQRLLDKIKDKDGSLTDGQKDSLKRMEELWKNRQSDPNATPPTPPKPIDPMTNLPMPQPTPPVGPGPKVAPISELPPPTPPKPKDRDSWWTRKSKELLPKGDSSSIKKGESNNSEWSKKMREFSSNHMPRFDTKKLSDNTPTVHEGPRSSPKVPKVDMPSGGGGGSGSGVGSAGSGLGNFFLGLLAVIVVGVVAFVVFRILQNRKAGAGNDLASLGIVPVDPSQVRTRGDLVRAFEYLALKLLGYPARNEHHLEIGQQLGTTPAETPQRREAAGELTHLYEQARYTPPEEELTPEELQAARRDLTMLGGAAVS